MEDFFSETPAYGELTIRVDLEEENKKAAGLLLMALRDVGLGILLWEAEAASAEVI